MVSNIQSACRICQCGPPLGILNKLKPSDIFTVVIATFTSGIYKAEYPVLCRCPACQIGNMRWVMYIWKPQLPSPLGFRQPTRPLWRQIMPYVALGSNEFDIPCSSIILFCLNNIIDFSWNIFVVIIFMSRECIKNPSPWFRMSRKFLLEMGGSNNQEYVCKGGCMYEAYVCIQGGGGSNCSHFGAYVLIEWPHYLLITGR